MKQKILFLVNPISGGISKNNFPDLVSKNLDHRLFDDEIRYWTDDKNAAEMTSAAVKEGFDIVVAVGGDGTINQVASTLKNTGKTLGIVPMGSGNGLARYLGIPMKAEAAIQRLNTASVHPLDSMELNDKVFMNVAGTGFDAHIGHLFATAGSRGLSTYASITLRELKNYQAQEYTIYIDGKVYHEKAFLVSFANGSQWGNNAFIAPQASASDGLVDVAVMNDFKWWEIPFIAIKLFTGKIGNSKRVKIYRGREVRVVRSSEGAVHLDGEPFSDKKDLMITVSPASLNILI